MLSIGLWSRYVYSQPLDSGATNVSRKCDRFKIGSWKLQVSRGSNWKRLVSGSGAMLKFELIVGPLAGDFRVPLCA